MKIRLTEGQLHKVIRESVRRIIREENEREINRTERQLRDDFMYLKRMNASKDSFMKLYNDARKFALTVKPGPEATDRELMAYNKLSDFIESIDDVISNFEVGKDNSYDEF